MSSGKLRPLGVTSAERLALATPNIPAIAETVPGYRVESWYGIYAPAGTPAGGVAKLNAAIGKARGHRRIPQEAWSPKVIVISAGAPGELDEYRSRRRGALAQDRQGKQHQGRLNFHREGQPWRISCRLASASPALRRSRSTGPTSATP